MSRVLIVDDEAAIRRLLEAILSRAGHDFIAAPNAAGALAALDRGNVDVILLDLGLPDRDGLEVIAAVRQRCAIPIIVLTARHETAEKISALDLGADDYVTKPFDSDELLARLRSALRRSGTAMTGDDACLEFGPVSMDLARHEVRCNDAPVALTPREYAVLKALLQASGRILTHAAILEQVWGKAHIESVDYLRVVIRALRLKLEADPSDPRLIRNEPGIGYRLVG
ncbi:response regulator transcription factor [Novosphingobium mathurense]|uniref:Two-component system, OmpR family, KDP operon response regulator KdpE n=1 Tax=Novosphingobium mathurense TaxID=428990 RepID=A0A1U6IVY1_9SPHN|nr:response regulator transcription factor [Novosphingobium mathurense]SLK12151.1 two-component system, OmpR family, KDP operon response regulator KdpE [Novosphingobium mathurense]